MSDTISEAAPPETIDPTQAPLVAKPKPTPPGDEGDPKWLPDRLERERRAVLKQLGVDNVEDAKSAIVELKKLREQQMTETEKLQLRVRELEQASKDLDAYRNTVGALAGASLQSLNEDQRQVVLDLAGDDPAAQIRTIDKLRPTWSRPSGPSDPMTTSPSGLAPKPIVKPEQSKYDTWVTLKEGPTANPVAAAAFLLQHHAEISKSKPAK